MGHFVENASWNFDFVWNIVSNTNTLSTMSLITCSLHAHLDDMQRDEDIMNNVFIWFQETRTRFMSNKHKFPNFNLNATYFVHGVLTCIKEHIKIFATKNLFQRQIWACTIRDLCNNAKFIMNIYATYFTHVSMIIEIISIAKIHMLHHFYILILIGDFKINPIQIAKESNN